jgi:hypothetical protein
MRIAVPTFKGINNAFSPRLIENEQASSAANCFTRNGNLTPLKSNASEGTPTLAANAKSLFLYQDAFWFSWTGVVNAVDSPIAQDDYQRVYFTGDGVPKYTNSSTATGAGVLPFASYELGVDNPTSFSFTVTYHDQAADLDEGELESDYPTMPDSGFINIETDDDETRFYVCTYVTAYGEEGPPSVITSNIELYHPTDSVTLNFSDTGGFGQQNITQRRIYRSATSGESTELYLVAEIPVTDTSYTDNVAGYALGALLATDDYDKPPTDMVGLIVTATGVAIGYTGNTIVPSEPYLPYAYPTGYRQSLPDNIKGLVEMNGGIVVATDNKPAILYGSTPDSYTLNVLDAAFPCVSSRSLVDMGEAAIYASHDGLVSVSQGGAQLITTNLLSKEYWRSLNPETIEAYRYHEYYIGFYGASAGFMFDLRTGNYFELDFYASAGYFDSASGKLYLVVNDALVSFDNGSELTYTWESKQFDLTNTTFSVAKIRGESLDNTQFAIEVDGTEIMSVALSGADRTVRLPPFRARRLSFKLTGTDEIESVIIASSTEELRIG